MRSQENVFVSLSPQNEVGNIWICCTVTSTWVANNYFILRDPNLRSRTNISLSVTPTWGRKQIFFIIRDHNLWSHTNILMYPNPFKGALLWNFNSETHFSKGNKMLLIIQFRSVISMWGFKQISLKELYFGTLILKPIFQK